MSYFLNIILIISLFVMFHLTDIYNRDRDDLRAKEKECQQMLNDEIDMPNNNFNS